jgi:hypothetical protein
MKRIALLVFRFITGAVGFALVLWASRGAFETIQTYRYPDFIDLMPRFTVAGEIENWCAVSALLLGGIYLCKSAVTGSWKLKR